MGGMRFYKRTVKDVPIAGKTVLVRVDYNVPLTPDGKVADDFRIRASIPTIRYVLKQGCKVVLIAHLGRPEGVDPKLSLEPAAQRLAELLAEPVRFVDKTVGEKVRMAIKRAPKRSITVLENLRFHTEEESNDENFARQLAKDSGARYFVQDGFGVVHRDHASTAAITLFLPSVAGLLLAKEYLTIVGAMKHPKRPLVAMLGGAKVGDKIAVIDEFIKVADRILIGGAMANTFLAYKGVNVGSSKVETDQAATIDRIYKDATEKVGADQVDEFIVLPMDVAVGRLPDDIRTRRVAMLADIAPDDMCLDIGDATAEKFADILRHAKTVVWNGTMGYAEAPAYARGSEVVADAMTEGDTESIVGGGDTADFVIHWDSHQGDSFSHVSTGGGAGLELMAGEKLPGIEHLLDA
ncbi:phosphoglycerate kinase [Candidatus Saccharibacteria bacterium]|nr:phosphoglycerate kinase [Candidatus Saccharibacteria bacterium]